MPTSCGSCPVAVQRRPPKLDGGGLRSVIARFHNLKPELPKQSPFETARFHLRGLNVNGSYTIKDLESGKEWRQTGKELGEVGLEVTIGNHPGVAILAYHRVN